MCNLLLHGLGADINREIEKWVEMVKVPKESEIPKHCHSTIPLLKISYRGREGNGGKVKR